MECYEVTEQVSSGISVSYPCLRVGSERGRKCTRVPLWSGTCAWLEALVGDIEEGERLLLKRGEVLLQGRGICLLSERDYAQQRQQRKRESEEALVLVRTAPGDGGRTFFVRNSRVAVLADGEDENGGVERLVCMRPGGLFRIERTGELEGAAPEIAIGWDGAQMHELHHTARFRMYRKMLEGVTPSAQTLQL